MHLLTMQFWWFIFLHHCGYQQPLRGPMGFKNLLALQEVGRACQLDVCCTQLHG
jgi:hypothetical protein